MVEAIKRKMESKEINGKKFTVMMLPPRKAMVAMIDVSSVFGPLISKLMKTGLDKMKTEEQFMDALPEVIAALSSVPQDKFEKLVNTMAEVSIADFSGGGPLHVKFDEVFSEDLISLYSWLWFAVQVNFGEFFRNALKGATAKA